MGLRPASDSTAAKQSARRQGDTRSAAYSRGWGDGRAAARQGQTDSDPVAHFASLLPYAALKAAFRTALKELHPDHGGNEERAKELIAAWKEIERLHEFLNTDAGEYAPAIQ